jgi:alkanesulfonate monooxygenase SsuD/methylene tetrahydromethanopterin reductase-like flavin-dependent oxidoreductase (luciferase family)
VLGSSDYGAQLAAHLPYAFAYFFMDGQGVRPRCTCTARATGRAARHPEPKATICIWALAAETSAEAAHHALSRERWRVDRKSWPAGPLAAARRHRARGFAPDEWPTVDAMRASRSSATPRKWPTRCGPSPPHCNSDHLVVNTWAYDPAVRRRSYALIAREFGLDTNLARSAA